MGHRRFFIVAVLLALLCGRASAAAILSSATIQGTPGNGAFIALNFPQVPRFEITGTGTSEVVLTFLDSQTPQIPPLQAVGNVRAAEFVQSGTALVLRLHLLAAAPVSVNRIGTGIIVNVAGAPAMNARPSPLSLGAAGAPPPVTAGTIEIVPLKYADVSEVVGILVAGQTLAPNDTFNAQPSSLGTSLGGTSLGGVSTGSSLTPTSPVTSLSSFNGVNAQSLGQRINENIAIDRRLNAVVLSGPPEVVASLREAIASIDVPLESVLLETQIVELSDTAAKDAGIDFTNGVQGQLATAGFAAKSGGIPTSTASLQASLYDVVAHGGGRVLARPQIVAQSGTSASILTGDALPILSSITYAGSAPVVQQQVQYVNVGVNLQIQPRITADGYVTSHIYSEVSSVTGYTGSYPQISQRVASTTATVRNGESFVIGGLIQENEIDNLAKIPGLGDLPLIGSIFRTRHDSTSRTNLYIVVTPRIVQRASDVMQPAGLPSTNPSVNPAPATPSRPNIPPMGPTR